MKTIPFSDVPKGAELCSSAVNNAHLGAMGATVYELRASDDKIYLIIIGNGGASAWILNEGGGGEDE